MGKEFFIQSTKYVTKRNSILDSFFLSRSKIKLIPHTHIHIRKVQLVVSLCHNTNETSITLFNLEQNLESLEL